MRTYLKRFDSHDDYIEYAESSGFVAPNLSCCSASTTHIHYNMTAPPIVQGHEYVDLGLPSGTLWATDYICDSDGHTLFFAWGEVLGYTADEVWDGDRLFDWTTYTYANGSDNKLTKYCPTGATEYLDENFSGDSLTELTETDDVAYTVWGNRWRTPSTMDFNELLDYTTSSVTYTENEFYLTLTSIENGNKIVFKGKGYANGDSVNSYGDLVLCLTREFDMQSPSDAWLLVCAYNGNEDVFFDIDAGNRAWGFPIRPIILPPPVTPN